ncbi:MAG: ribonuclease HI [Desulfobacteraceae bacterium]|nr:ribonuclease HI [Desulfobacteraceae bacterium]
MTKIDVTKIDPPDNNWKRMSFKGNKVWVATGPDGLFLEEKGKVLIKYNLKQDYEYWAKAESLAPVEQAVPAGKKKAKAPEKSSKAVNSQLKIPDNCIQIYTDGASSGNPGPAGIGALLIYHENRKEISQSIGIATNNVAELSAIQIAISHLKRHDLPVRIFSDSSYAIGVLTQNWKSQANKELVSEIKGSIQRFSDIELIKVKGHAGIKENEVADFLATSAIKKGI